MEVDNGREEEKNEVLLTQSQALVQELKQFLPLAKERQFGKKELIFGLQQILKKYKLLKNTAFQVAINHVIETDCENTCSIHLSADDVSVLWIS